MRRVVLLAVIASVSALPAAAATDRQTRTFSWPSDRALVVEITVGEVRIQGSERGDVEIAVQRTAPTEDILRQRPLTFEETPARVALSLVQPDGNTDPSYRTDVVLRVPLHAHIERLRITEGKLVVDRFRGTLSADVRRGPIEGTEISGTLRLETSIGSITLRQARLAPDGLLRLRAFNGDVRLQMPGAPTDARLLALALNGTIRSDIPMTSRDSWGPRWSEATLGKGEPVISIDVVTGNVEIRTR